MREPSDTVKVVVGRTVKGYGCASMEQNFFEWHRKSPSPESYEELMSELNAKTV